MTDDLIPRRWYWIRRGDGSLAPHVFHRLTVDRRGRTVGEFFVGSFLTTFGLNQVVGPATMPHSGQQDQPAG